jgi:pimeloyl-ACP methyl ester carboxylesterase
VARLLVEAGHEAIAVDLPGDDESKGLTDYAEIVIAAIDGRTDVVLVAGSLGGFTAPIVCERAPAEAVGELVLVNAMIPKPGETAGAWWDNTRAVEAREAAAQDGGYGPFQESTYFLHDIDPDLAAEGEPFQRPQSDGIFESVCDFTGWPPIPARVLAGNDDRFFPVDLQRRVARERLGVEADVIPGGHLLPMAQPRLVTDYLRQ